MCSDCPVFNFHHLTLLSLSFFYSLINAATNHLDEDSLQCLAAAVKKFEGAVAIVSHNQDFMAQCAKEMWTVANSRVKVEVVDGEVETFDDAFVRYRESLRKELR